MYQFYLFMEPEQLKPPLWMQLKIMYVYTSGSGAARQRSEMWPKSGCGKQLQIMPEMENCCLDSTHSCFYYPQCCTPLCIGTWDRWTWPTCLCWICERRWNNNAILFIFHLFTIHFIWRGPGWYYAGYFELISIVWAQDDWWSPQISWTPYPSVTHSSILCPHPWSPSFSIWC